ncbi:hypothetical protein RQP54_12025 [Curvibacter sp. APW13]|uniref:hypothetical protein n=1 Tax=Curvibacter sp. APW13 TaxID=3077236 RepID=UPI0028DD6015|nr:hypothetical protein [Curvibacter sp. APW13]MDT8991588.1 hypothetical protein [Curvibacter sp. APW13]
MWFVFGFVTLISFSVYFGLRRYKANWKGLPATHHGIAYRYLFQTEKQRRGILFDENREYTPSLKVSVEAPREFEFVLKRESAFDRACKWLGLANEYQAGDSEFDDLVYVVSNDQHLTSEVISQESMRDAALALFNMNLHECRASEIRCHGGRVWVMFKVGKKYREASSEPLLHEVAERSVLLLHDLVQCMQAGRPESSPRSRDPFAIRAAVVLAGCTGLLANGLTHSLRQGFTQPGFVVDTSLLWTYAAYGGMAVVIALVVLTLWWLGRTARTHLVLIEIVLVGSIGAVLTMYSEVQDLNWEADHSPTEMVNAKVIAKSVSHSHKGGASYFVHVTDWIAHGQTRKVRVSSGFYEGVQSGALIEFRQRAGFLGVRWVESYRLIPKI